MDVLAVRHDLGPLLGRHDRGALVRHDVLVGAYPNEQSRAVLDGALVTLHVAVVAHVVHPVDVHVDADAQEGDPGKGRDRRQN